MNDFDRAVPVTAKTGFVTIHARKGNDHILGATIVARHAGEMINQITLAMVAGVGLRSPVACYRVRARLRLFIADRAS